MAGKDRVAAKSWTTGPPQMDPGKIYINPQEEDQMEIQGYSKNRLKTAVSWVLICVTGGLLRLLFHWVPHWYLRLTHNECSLADATAVLLKDQYQQWFVAQIQTITKDGTQVRVVKPSAFISLTASSRRRQAQLLLNSGQRDENLIRYFIVKKVKYLWDPDEYQYQKLRGLEENNTCSYFHEAKGLAYQHQAKRRVLYGANSIAIHVTPIIVLLFKEALSPFYVFQLFSMCVWYWDEYYYYATCIILISTVSLGTSIYQTRKMQRALRNTIHTSSVVSVCRGGDEYEDLPSEDLVPGDVIEIPQSGCMMHCDAVLISGNCIVNESMLTGESVPVTKTPIPDTRQSSAQTMFDLSDHARHTLFCGTHVIQTRYYGHQKVKAVVIRTGFLTSKGELVRAILHPKPVDFKFNKDTYIFIGVLALIAAIGLIYTVILKASRGDPVGDIFKRSLDLITITVPPALPAALTVGIVFAQRRMKESGIYCISPRSINICGSINAVCFDKTGTLTEDGLNMQGIVPATDGTFDDEITNMLLLDKGRAMYAMATCHSLTMIGGILSGDPLDLIMFQALNWHLEEAGEENSRFDMLVPTIVYPVTSSERTMNAEELSSIDTPADEIGIVRQFTFSSSLQRMSVIVRHFAGTNFDLYCKGSPEMVTSLCKPDTVPENFYEVLKSYTQHGYRVLGLAYKPLPAKYNYVKVQRLQREQVEKDLTFLGLLVMENKLKPETTPIIRQLAAADVKTIMVTGDNMLTALSVAHECKMVSKHDKIVLVEAQVSPGASDEPEVQFLYEDSIGKTVTEVHIEKNTGITEIEIDDNSKLQFATTGRSWAVLRQHFPDILSKILVRGVVFARMSPEQKAQLVESLQELGYYVGMCGDGANDCGALKTAHTGISLSEAEASVASPFTSNKPNIECVPTVIREGRAALVTSFGIFKYMACYSLTQFVSVLILYKVESNLTDFQFLYIDLFLLTTLSVTYGRTAAFPHLVKDPPQLSLTSLAPIMSLIIQMAIQISAQVFCFFNIQQQPWFESHVSEEEYDYQSYENTAVFSMSAYQYIILAVAFSKGSPYRRTMFTNYLFLVNIVLCVATTFWVTVYPLDWMVDFFELKPPPSVPYRLVFFGISIANCFLSIILETFLLDHAVIRRKFNSFRERCFPSLKFQYSSIEEEMASTPGWPPVGPQSPISCLYRQDTYATDYLFAKETDKMLPTDSSDYNCSSVASLPNNSSTVTPKTSTSDKPFSSNAMVSSSEKSSITGNAYFTGSSRLSGEETSEETDNVNNDRFEKHTDTWYLDNSPSTQIEPENSGYGFHDKSPL